MKIQKRLTLCFVCDNIYSCRNTLMQYGSLFVKWFVGGGKMYDDVRLFGNNCQLQMQKNNIGKSEFAEKLGYSDDEVKKLLEGKLPLFNDDIKDIAAFFNISESEMFKNYGDQAYNDAGCMHCMGDFINPENKELILDIFDQYCTLEECIE